MKPPRYAPDSPFPAFPYLPGKNLRDANFQPAASIASDDWRSDPAYLHGVDLFNHQFYWEAHEAWEHRWLPLADGDPRRTHLQGLIQASAALLKIRLLEPTPACSIWKRGRSRLLQVAAGCPQEAFLGIEILPLVQSIDTIIEVADPEFEAPCIVLSEGP
ncbi:MAG: DUF309 domain-containing protein [Planctomycetota bacterium]|nr:DUF309 domain-containing protein [Planctomycetota bacterium]